VRRVIACLCLALAFASASARASEGYPDRPVTLIVPFAAGGPTDVIARIVAPQMARALGQPVIVENVIGEAGQRAVARAAEAAPDGYTLLMGHMGTHGAAPALYPDLKHDPIRDFAPIGMASGTPIVIVASKQFPPNNLREFIAYARAENGKLKVAHAGRGSVSHSAGALLNSVLGIKPTLIGYGGTGPAVNDLVAGKIDFMTDQIVNVAPKIEAGRIKAFAIAIDERSPALPLVPTTKEAGLPQYAVNAWNAIFAPARTPPAIVARLNQALGRALDDENTRLRLLDLGAVIPERSERSPAALFALVKTEIARWKRVLADLNGS
jgi:tripartite-type tricarboxylate transporter receptor subunit TctC